MNCTINQVAEIINDRSITKDDIEQAIIVELLEKGSWYPNAMNVSNLYNELGMIRTGNDGSRMVIGKNEALELEGGGEYKNTRNALPEVLEEIKLRLGSIWVRVARDLLAGHSKSETLERHGLKDRQWRKVKPVFDSILND